MNRTDSKLLGFFSNLKDLEEIKAKAVLLPGFRDYPDCFGTDFYILDKIHWKDGFQTEIGEIGQSYIKTGDVIDDNYISIKELNLNIVFNVSHSYPLHAFMDDERYIGLFSSLEKAENAIKELKKKPGFIDHQDDFDISELDLATLLWSSGFGSL